jgi:synaptobrevin family protein YKT6
MKITALLVLKSPGGSASASASGGREQQQAVVLANASDVSHLGYFQRPAAREFVVFVARTVALRTPAGRRQSVQHQGTQVPACLFLLLAPPPTPTQSVANN